MFLYFCFLRNLAPDSQFSTLSWIEKIVIIGGSQPSSATLKNAGQCHCYIIVVNCKYRWLAYDKLFMIFHRFIWVKMSANVMQSALTFSQASTMQALLKQSDKQQLK